MLWASRHIVFVGLCFGWMLQVESTLAQVNRPPSSSSLHEFIPNRGQLADQFGKPMPEVLYTLDGHGVKFYFTKNSMHYVFTWVSGVRYRGPEQSRFDIPGPRIPDTGTHLSLYRVDAHFLGANPNVWVTAEDTASDYTNYYLPQCPNGITHVPAFHKIIYHDLYPHIDMVFYAGSEYQKDHNDFIVHPGGNPNQIKIQFDGQDSLLKVAGNLRVVSPFGEVTELAPSSYQGERQVTSHYHLRSNILSYTLGHYDRARDLTIDPPRLWGTYFGGPENDPIYGIGVDKHNNIDIIGNTSSISGIATSGAYQTTLNPGESSGYIASFGPAGNIRWATYYGSSSDVLWGCACDTSCGIVAIGTTSSTSGIATPGAYQIALAGNSDAFLISFDSNGMRRWGSYFGGPGQEQGLSVAIDSSGNIVMGGTSNSSSGIATPGAYHTTYDSEGYYIAKFTPAGSLIWATYYAAAVSISCDRSDNIYTIGNPGSGWFASPGAYQVTPGLGLISKIFPNSQRDWATNYFTPGSGGTVMTRIAASRMGNVYIAGYTDEDDHATQNAYQTHLGGGFGPVTNTDGFLMQFDSSGALKWATYYGGEGADELYAIGVDTDENVVAGGWTESTTRIASSGEYQTSLLSSDDPFMVKFDSTGILRWGTYYGQNGVMWGISIDRLGHPAVCGYTYTTTNVFASSGAYRGSPPGGENDGFVARFCDTLEIGVTITPSKHLICPGTSLTLTAGAGLASYQWSLNGTAIPGATSTTYTVPGTLKTGTYTYQVNGPPANSNVCEAASYPITIVVGGATIAMAKPASLCSGSSVRLFDTITGIGTLRYSWTPAAGLDYPDSAEPVATPSTTTTYTLSVTDTAGCTSSKSITIMVHSPPMVTLPTSLSLCAGSSLTLSATIGGGQEPFTYSWSPATGLNRTDTAQVIASPSKSSIYTFRITDANGCSDSASVLVQVNPVPKIGAGPARSICPGGSIKIGGIATGGIIPYKYTWVPVTGLSDPTIAQPVASPTVTTLYTITVTDQDGCMAMDSVLVTVADSLSPSVTPNGPLTFCTGDTVVLDAGTGYATYVWSTGEKTPAIAVTKTGNYFVHVTNTSGCSGTSTALHVTMLPDSVPHPVLTAGKVVICDDDSVEVGLEAPTYTAYRWSTGDSSSSIFVSKSGSYSVTVTNAAGCSGTSAPLMITVMPAPTATIVASGPVTFCSGDSVTLTATPGNSSYRWNTGAGGSTGDSTASIVVKSSGSYFVAITNAAGCTGSSAPLTVTVNSAPNPSISGPASICPNSTTTYTVATNPGNSYTWTLVPAGAGTIANSTSASTSIQWGAAGTATLFLTEIAPDGCSAFTFLPITSSSNLAPIVTGTAALCSGDSTTLDAQAGYASYQWSKDGSSIAGATSDSITVGKAGNYTVFVTSAGGCSGTSAPVRVTLYPVPSKPIIIQAGGVLRSTPAAHYQWSHGGSMLTDSVTQTIAPDTDGLYTVTITDSNGCSSTSDPFNYSSAAWAFVSLPENIIGAPGDTISIPITLDSSHDLLEAGASTYAASIGLDPTMLTPIRPPGVRVGTHWIVTLTGTTPTKPGLLQTITALALDSGYCSDLTVDTFYFPGANVTVTEHSGSFCLNTPCTPVLISSDTAFTIKRVSPNPGQGEFTIEYHVAAEGPLSMELEDYLGRMVTVLKQGWCKPGDETETYSVQNISSGLYRLILRSGARELSRPLVIAK